jgi:FkbM family methyltransferase
MRWVVGSSTHGCWLGSYEFEKQKLFAALVPSGGVVWDVGAHVGFYTLLAARLVGPAGRVVAFEPFPRNQAFLHRHIDLNALGNVDVIEAAVGEKCGPGSFSEGGNSSTGSLFGVSDGIAVRVVTLDSMLSNAASRPPHVIKMDIEGGELEALRGADELLSTSRPAIFLATHSRELHGACIEHLHRKRYSIAGLNGRSIMDTDELIATPE